MVQISRRNKIILLLSITILLVVIARNKYLDYKDDIVLTHYKKSLLRKYIIQKQEDDPFNLLDSISKVEIACFYEKINEFGGEIVFFSKKISFSDSLVAKMSIYYHDREDKSWKHIKRRTITYSSGKFRIDSLINAKLSMNDFPGICDDQYYKLKCIDGRKPSSYGIVYVGFDGRLLTFNAVFGNTGENYKSIKTQCSPNTIISLVDKIDKEIDF